MDGNVSVRDALEDPFGVFVSPDGKTVINANNNTSSNHRCLTQLELSTPLELSTATLVEEIKYIKYYCQTIRWKR